MKSEHTIQLLLSWIITWISTKFQAFGILLLCLLFLMFIDYITGMLASRKEGIEHPDDTSYGWNSQKGFIGIMKKTGCWLIICSVFFVDGILPAYRGNYLVFVPSVGHSQHYFRSDTGL